MRLLGFKIILLRIGMRFLGMGSGLETCILLSLSLLHLVTLSLTLSGLNLRGCDLDDGRPPTPFLRHAAVIALEANWLCTGTFFWAGGFQ